jgi:hypothetical protein
MIHHGEAKKTEKEIDSAPREAQLPPPPRASLLRGEYCFLADRVLPATVGVMAAPVSRPRDRRSSIEVCN